MIGSLLIANRGEIACRIIRTARRLGVRTVAVYSDADAGALHVAAADVAVRIGPAPASESYLAGDRIIAAAQESGAEAIHPGYGFLSENAEFAQAVLDAGLVWIGPKPAAIAAMGLKDAAKRLMQEAGVPVTPGYLGEDQDPTVLAGQAELVGYPLLIKAVAGGGGKGMRLVERPSDFPEALAACQREAQAAFGNPRVLLEKCIIAPRHIEVQVFGDSHGNIVHLFERDCSLQRRHQKVIEEAPAPGMDAATRVAVCAAAVRAARTVNYEGAGTVEFIADAAQGLSADRIWFMEMNTRLQVEHPVTEAVTGQDLVEWQLRVASGEPLPLRQDEIPLAGWAMEARLYAEDPARGFLPAAGRLDVLRFGMAPGGRIDTGVRPGDEIALQYDPMIAKIVAQGATRGQALERLRAMVEGTAVWPVRTNAGFLARVLAHPRFAEGVADTGLIEREGASLTRPEGPSPQALAEAAARLVRRSCAPGFRLNAGPQAQGRFLLDGAPVQVALSGAGTDHPADAALATEKGQAWLLQGWRRDGQHGPAESSGAILAPMPGKVISLEVRPGQTVTRGQKLLTLEAMKMEHALRAPFDGTVAELRVAPGAQVQVEDLLVRIEQGGD
ncbi:methylcrotonoyl-CoA carboxylase [Novosphingobium flavum]|uniref:Methylcrotonoyl-CoA carboxylase n=1 Tax=Novosphingobium flavum TaxID=1778672 RepID=A0A7X1FRK0_9SPHN|nr:biotin carboxylase N-terminal domain-containing protein [Novosphingobium flavum]MBC2665529.1 methylcrotonoyl-CoA carboxylase [Novosphingobium flavum]